MTDVNVANVSNFPFKEIDFLFLINFHQKNEVRILLFDQRRSFKQEKTQEFGKPIENSLKHLR